jgi:hypothetical protein
MNEIRIGRCLGNVLAPRIQLKRPTRYFPAEYCSLGGSPALYEITLNTNNFIESASCTHVDCPYHKEFPLNLSPANTLPL